MRQNQPLMRQIRPWLYIGKYRDTLNPVLLAHYQIDAMLQFAEHVPYPHITTCYLNIDDGVPLPAQSIEQGISFIVQAYQQQQTLLIACRAGISRSSSFAIAALKETEALSLFEAFKVVKQQHPNAMPHPVIWESFCAYYKEHVPHLDLLRFG